MYATSQQWAGYVKDSHTKTARVEAWRSDSDFTVFNMVDGKVTVKLDDPIRWSADLVMVDETVQRRAYAEITDLIDPLITTFRPYRGVTYPDTTTEVIPLGVLHGTEVSAAESRGAVQWRISAFDLASRAQEPLTSPYYIAPGMPFEQAIPQLLQKQVPRMSFRLATTPWVTPSLVMREGELPWSKARSLAQAAGLDLYMDRNGVCVSSARVVTAAEAPVWSFVEGDSADFWDPQRKLAADAYPNVVVVMGTNPSSPCSGIAWDNDPKSPTYRYGAYGEHVKVVRSEMVTSEDQANAAARYVLSRSLGPQDEVTFNALPNPALDVGDTVTVVRSRIGMGASQRMIVSQIEMPLTLGSMAVTCRRSILTADDVGPVRS